MLSNRFQGVVVLILASFAPLCVGAQTTHGFLVTGAQTYVKDGQGVVTWRYPASTRDGWVLSDGKFLLVLSRSKEFPGGGVVEVDQGGKTLFAYKGTQSEVNTAQPLEGDRILLTEAGDHPRILEVDRQGKMLVEVLIQAQTKDHHLQTRMTRKLANGNYLVPQLLDKVVREYDAQGVVVWEVKTPDMPFTAIRMKNGNTLIGCTRGNLVIEVDARGETVWRLTNDDLLGRPLKDVCGVQRLPNGNTVMTNYGAGIEDLKLIEVSPEKKVVWTYRDPKSPSIHHFQILDTDGKSIEGVPMR